MKKSILSAFILVAAAVGLLVAQAGVKKREFTGDITVQICEKDSTGKWLPVDELKVPAARFVSSVSDLAGKKGVSSDFAFSGKTNKGRNVAVRLKPNGTADVDLATGFLSLNLPFAITVEGKQADTTVKLSTESAQGATGTISGRRAKINSAARTASLKLVGSTTLRSPIPLSAGPTAGGLTTDQAAERKGEKAQERADQIAAKQNPEALLVVTGDGTLKALD